MVMSPREVYKGIRKDYLLIPKIISWDDENGDHTLKCVQLGNDWGKMTIIIGDASVDFREME